MKGMQACIYCCQFCVSVLGFSFLCQIITDVFRLRRDFVRLSLCLPLNAGSTLNSAQIAQGFIQLGLKNLQRRRLHSFSGQPVPLLDWVHGEFFVPFTHQNLYTFLNTYFILMDFPANMAALDSHWILETLHVLLCSWIQQSVFHLKKTNKLFRLTKCCVVLFWGAFLVVWGVLFVGFLFVCLFFFVSKMLILWENTHSRIFSLKKKKYQCVKILIFCQY